MTVYHYIVIGLFLAFAAADWLGHRNRFPDIAFWRVMGVASTILYFTIATFAPFLWDSGEVPEKVRAWGEKLALEALGRPRALVHPEFYAKRFGRQHLALTDPVRFVRTLLAERRTGDRAIPDIGNLPRE